MRIQRYGMPLATTSVDLLSIKSVGATLCLLVLCGSMVGCASRPSADAAKSSRASVTVPEFHVVRRGDTVSKIAARYGLDYPDIGRINQLNSQYTIYPNQRLRLRSRQAGDQASMRNMPRSVNTTAIRPSIPMRTQPLPMVTAAATHPAMSQGLLWQWPTSNPILQDFNESAHIKGIRFDGKLGEPVLAAAAGEVVYANNGLTEYGNLVLLRHGNGYITAYAHNQRLLVQEGQTVNLGQPIAEIGHSGTNRIMLEFQVRKDGKPINPKQVLPRR